MTARGLAMISFAMLAGTAALAVFASGELAEGFVEIPDHWWSTFMVGFPLAGAGLAALLSWRRR